MKSFKNWTLTVIACVGALAFSSCNDYDYDKETARAELLGPFSVTSATGNTYKATIDGDNISLKINPFANVESELSNAMPTFFLPMGATCTPAPYEPQDFTKEVKYTITSGDGKSSRTYTVNWAPSDQLPYGQGYTASSLLAEKTFVQLGYPGKWCDFSLAAQQYGDLLLSVAFCGPEHVVGFSRVYAWEGTGGTDTSLAFKVWDAKTLEETNLSVNLGPLSPGQIVNVTSDWKGHMVAATGGLNNAPSDIYYWTSVDAAPVKVGTLPVPVYFNSHALDANCAIAVAGDITADAAISYLAPRSPNGDHNVAYVRSGEIAGNTVITTGYPSNDRSYTQMISLFGPDENASYLVGDTEGEKQNGSVKVYYQTAAGLTLGTMPAYMNGLNYTDGITCWVATGCYLERGGGRRPFVMAMQLNGKDYSLVLTGYDWDNFNVMMNGDMTEFIQDALTYDNRRYMTDLMGAAGFATHWSYGSCGTWYWDDEKKEGKVATWMGRATLSTFMMHCYE